MNKAVQGRALTVVVVGATGAVGRDLVSSLESPPFPVRDLRLAATRASHEVEIPWGKVSLEVHGLGGKASAALFEGADLVILATPAEVARALGPPLAARGLGVLDLSGGLAGQAPLVLPAVDPTSVFRFSERRILCFPGATTAALATLLAQLRALGLRSCRGTAILSASAAGRAGTEELSAQVVALFNSQNPPRKVFPDGLAFDLRSPAFASPRPGAWADSERRAAQETAAFVGLSAERVAITEVLAPVFAGISLSVWVDFDRQVEAGAVSEALAGADGVQLADPVGGPRHASGRGRLQVGRIRADPEGEGVHIVAVADNLRFGAVAHALAAATALWREGLIGAPAA